MPWSLPPQLFWSLSNSWNQFPLHNRGILGSLQDREVECQLCWTNAMHQALAFNGAATKWEKSQRPIWLLTQGSAQWSVYRILLNCPTIHSKRIVFKLNLNLMFESLKINSFKIQSMFTKAIITFNLKLFAESIWLYFWLFFLWILRSLVIFGFVFIICICICICGCNFCTVWLQFWSKSDETLEAWRWVVATTASLLQVLCLGSGNMTWEIQFWKVQFGKIQFEKIQFRGESWQQQLERAPLLPMLRKYQEIWPGNEMKLFLLHFCAECAGGEVMRTKTYNQRI